MATGALFDVAAARADETSAQRPPCSLARPVPTSRRPTRRFGRQMGLRVAKSAETPITATVITLESRAGERSLDAAVMVSCDWWRSLTCLPKSCKGTAKTVAGFRFEETDPQRHAYAYRAGDATECVRHPVASCNPSPIASLRPTHCRGDRKGVAATRAGKRHLGLGHAAIAEKRRATYATVMRRCTARPTLRTSAASKAT